MTEKIELNRATKEQLDEVDGLQGHGHEIVRYREERGGFTDVAQLDEVPGLTGKIGKDVYSKVGLDSE